MKNIGTILGTVIFFSLISILLFFYYKSYSNKYYKVEINISYKFSPTYKNIYSFENWNCIKVFEKDYFLFYNKQKSLKSRKFIEYISNRWEKIIHDKSLSISKKQIKITATQKQLPLYLDEGFYILVCFDKGILIFKQFKINSSTTLTINDQNIYLD